jgi:NADH-quinone oxidoreductase subunit F
VWKGRKLKAVIPGGSSCPVVPGDVMMATNMDYDSVKKAGSSVGTGAVIVMDETTCMVRALERLARFYMSESCGQCTPCREGTGWLDRMLKRIIAGQGRSEDLGCCSMWPIASRDTRFARWAMRRRGRCRAS